MAFMDTLNDFATAVRVAEHGTDEKKHYLFYGDWLPRAGTRLLGAYKIPAKQWAQLSAQAGVAGADWRDPNAQDVVAKEHFARLYNRYQSWEPVAVAWKAGEDLADAMVSNQGSVDQIPGDMGRAITSYVDKTTSGFETDSSEGLLHKRVGSNPFLSQLSRPEDKPPPQKRAATEPVLRALLGRMRQNVQSSGGGYASPSDESFSDRLGAEVARTGEASENVVDRRGETPVEPTPKIRPQTRRGTPQ